MAVGMYVQRLMMWGLFCCEVRTTRLIGRVNKGCHEGLVFSPSFLQVFSTLIFLDIATWV